MSISICASCLSRLRLSFRTVPSLSIVPNTSTFHTSSALLAHPLKKKAGSGQTHGHRETRSAKIKKRTKERPKPPQVGERKAARNRIVLSNTNALEVPGMTNLSLENISDAEQIGKVLGLEGELLDQLREVKAFKTTQNWNMFRRPATLIREETINMGQGFKDVEASIQDQGVGPKTIRQVISGERSSGKSLLLLQAMSMAFLSKWVVINVPDTQAFVNNQSSYAPFPKAKGEQEQHYVQPHLASALLSRIAYANSDVLSKHKVLHDHSKSNLPISQDMTLKQLTMAGVEDIPHAWPIWLALWKELTSPVPDESTPPPPVLVAIDGLDHWMGPTKYRSSDYKILHAHQFLLIRHLLSYLFSTTSLANGGILLAATTASNSPTTPSADVLLRQLQARASGLEMTDPQFPMPEPYAKADLRVLNLLSGSDETTVQTLKGLSKLETKGLLEYFARSGLSKETVTEAVVGEKWSMSGGGVIGEMARLGTRLRV